MTPKTKKITQADCLRRFGDETWSFYVVGESAQQPGQVQICQYSTLLVGPISSARARALAAQLIAAADAVDGAVCNRNFAEGARCARDLNHLGPCSQFPQITLPGESR